LDVEAGAPGYGGYGAAVAPVQRASPYGFNGDLVEMGKPRVNYHGRTHGKAW